MSKLSHNIDGKVIKIKPKTKPKKLQNHPQHYRTIRNHMVRRFEEQLEAQLPNEFKGAISNYNHLSYGGYGNIDGNEYNFY